MKFLLLVYFFDNGTIIQSIMQSSALSQITETHPRPVILNRVLCWGMVVVGKVGKGGKVVVGGQGRLYVIWKSIASAERQIYPEDMKLKCQTLYSQGPGRGPWEYSLFTCSYLKKFF